MGSRGYPYHYTQYDKNKGANAPLGWHWKLRLVSAGFVSKWNTSDITPTTEHDTVITGRPVLSSVKIFRRVQMMRLQLDPYV